MPNLTPLVIAPGSGTVLFAPGGDVLVQKLTSAHSGNAYSLAEYTVEPGAGPPLHKHTHEDEAFWILDGVVSFQCDGRTAEAGPGTFIFAPRGSVHTFKNRTAAPARMLLFVSPPANFEAFYAKIGAPTASGAAPADQEMIGRIMAHAAAHGIEILGPSPL
jgi:quercetin dioxygenase-like cupin family protein